MPQASSRHVFVYGTLRRGGSNDITRRQPAPRYVGMAQVGGTLYDLGRYPGLLLGAAGTVLGEVYEIDAVLEQALDVLEEVRPEPSSEYFKRTVPVVVDGRELACLVYEINPQRARGHAVIAGGDWMLGAIVRT
jgi:gamma-glutamylcyclotransferase (GGCT)/AIG2-like uncharacterized protein YtfP